MVPSIARNGTSFRGAGRYYLLDKAEEGAERPVTAKRVAWTSTRNLAHEDPQQAIDEMWRTAEDAAHLKAMSGRSLAGRKSEAPVKTLSLSWAPHQSPTREEMEAAGDGFLRAMGWHEHQALFVAHSDEPHPHLHIILNRIHPETGRTLNDWQERKRAQRWALQYERDEGQILCLARVDKYEQGIDLAPNGTPYPFAKLGEEQERAFANPLAERAVLDRLEKDMLGERHREEREAFLASGKAQFRAARQAAYREVRDEFKPLWREHFQERQEALHWLDRQTRLVHAEALGLAREGDHAAAALLIAELQEHRDAVHEGLAADRARLREQQLEATRECQDEACRDVIALRAVAFQEIKDRQKDERAELKDLQAARDAGQPYDIDRLQELTGDPDLTPAANDDRTAERLLAAVERGESPERLFPDASQAETRALPSEDGPSSDPLGRPPRRDGYDLAGGFIGAAVELGIRVMEGFISPPTPLERAQAKARAIHEEQQAPVIAAQQQERKLQDDFTRHALTAVRDAQAEADRKRELAWEDRDRERYRER